MKKILLITLIMSVIWAGAYAQKKVTGNVTDASDGSTIPGVSIKIKGQAKGTVTDLNGKYSLTVSDADILIFSYMGYETQSITVGSQTTINVKLKVNSKELGEVVVTALGISREKKALGYAVTKVGSDNLSAVKESNPVNSLTGKVAGVVVTQSGAGVGSGSRIVIRGNNSISANNQPLIVVDGIPIDNTGANSGGNIWDSKVSGGGISDINQDDIESISVLKGPNAAALYGSRAGNGVILITTKKGKSGNGLGITFNSNMTFSNPLELPDYQNKYGQGTEKNIPANLGDLKNSSGSWGPAFDSSNQLYYTGDKRPYKAEEDNVKDFFETGKRYVNSLSLSGGGENHSLRFSYTNNDTKSMLPNSKLNSHNFNLRAFVKLTDRLNVDTKVTYFTQEAINKPSVGSQGVMAYVYTMPRNVSLNDLKKYQDLSKGYSSISYSSLGANPYWMQNHDNWQENRGRMMGFAKVTYKITDCLSVFARVGTDVTRTKTEAILQYGHHFKTKGKLWFGNSRSQETNTDFLLLFNKELNSDFNISANFGGNHSYRTHEGNNISGEDFKIPTRATVANLKKLNPPSYTPLEEKKVNSLYGSASLSFRRYLFLDITGRNDWSSTLPKENRSYFYPSVSLSAVLSQALEMPEWVNFLKIRGSWAMVGNDTGPYQIFEYYNVSGEGYNGTTQVNKNSVKFNSDLKPEKIISSELGFEFRTFNDRLYGDFSIYDIKTKDLIFDVDVPKSTGYSKMRTNIGEMQNKGIEFMLGGVPLKTEAFSWDITFNFSKNKNTLNELAKDLDSHVLNKTNHGDIVIKATVGGGYGDIYGKTWKKNDKGEILLNKEGKPQASSKNEYLGNSQPDWIAGITNTLNYKNFSLRFLIDGRFGGEIYSVTGAALDGAGVTKRTLQYRENGIVVDGVIEQEDGTFIKNTNNISGEKYWGSFAGIASEYVYKQTNVRLREISLGYKLPHKILSSTFIKDASISFVGRNLFFFYKDLDHFDPESSLGTSNNAQGILFYNLPAARTLGINLNIKF